MTAESSVIRQAYAYLKGNIRSYRTGVPVSSLKSLHERRKIEQTSSMRWLFVYLKTDSLGRKIESEHLELLKNVITKGLGFVFEDQLVLEVESIGQEKLMELERLCKASQPSRVVFLNPEFENIFESDTKSFLGLASLVTSSLIDVKNDTRVKKEFWDSLRVK